MGQKKGAKKAEDADAAPGITTAGGSRKRKPVVDATSAPPCFDKPPSPFVAWKKCTASEAELQSLVSQGLLLDKSILQWKSCQGELLPTENSQEIPLFLSFCERGFGMPASPFFKEFLSFYNLQVHHLNPNGILYLSVFVHACEAFLGIEPNLSLFRSLYHIKPQPTHQKIEVVGGAGIQFRQNMKAKWFDLPVVDSCGPWKNKWFIIGKSSALSYPVACRLLSCKTKLTMLLFCSAGNHGLSCPERDNWYPKPQVNWNTRPSAEEAQDVPALLERVQDLKNQGLTGVGIAFSFMKRRVQPLQQREHLGFDYEGPSDGSRTTPDDISDEMVLTRLNKMFIGVSGKPVIVGEYSKENPPTAVSDHFLH